jgi:probable HAF family extracellular repeat protein
MKRSSNRSRRSQQQRFRRKHSRSNTSKRRHLCFETFEPRMVLSSSSYVVFDLGTLPETDVSVAQDINNLGEVVGTSSRTGLVPQSRAFTWDATDGIQDLGTLGGTDAWATGPSTTTDRLLE